MNAIFIGDPHFKTDNIKEVGEFTKKMIKLAKEVKPDFICVGGDVLHTHERIHTTPLNKAYKFINDLRKISKVYVLVGNHDAINNKIFLTENHWMNGMKEWENVVIVDTVILEKMDDRIFVFSPYVPPGRFVEALNTIGKSWKNADCIFAHQEFRGCKMGAIISEEGDEWPLKFPHVISGHIHSRQRPQKNIYYPGSAMQNAFGESEKNIIAQLYWKKGEKNYELKEHDLDLARKKIIPVEAEDPENLNIEEFENKKDSIKISVKGSISEFKALRKTEKYKKLIQVGAKIVFKPKTHEKKEQDTEEKNTDFKKVLIQKISATKNTALYSVYEKVFGEKINFSNIVFVDDEIEE